MRFVKTIKEIRVWTAKFNENGKQLTKLTVYFLLRYKMWAFQLGEIICLRSLQIKIYILQRLLASLPTKINDAHALFILLHKGKETLWQKLPSVCQSLEMLLLNTLELYGLDFCVNITTNNHCMVSPSR